MTDPRITEILHDLAQFEATPAGIGHELRLDLADAIVNTCKTNGWTHRQLAERAGMKPAQLSRIVHGSTNCTFDVAARILFALGLRARLSIMPAQVRKTATHRKIEPRPKPRLSRPLTRPRA